VRGYVAMSIWSIKRDFYMRVVLFEDQFIFFSENQGRGESPPERGLKIRIRFCPLSRGDSISE
jgi:hypothetical protein